MKVRVDYLSKGDNALYDKQPNHRVLTTQEVPSSFEQPRVLAPLNPVNMDTLKGIMNALKLGIEEERETAILVMQEQNMGVLVP